MRRSEDAAIDLLIGHSYPIRELRLSGKARLQGEDEDERDDEGLAAM